MKLFEVSTEEENTKLKENERKVIPKAAKQFIRLVGNMEIPLEITGS